MKKIVIILLVNLMAGVATAQLIQLQTQLYFTPLTTNPALTAYNGSTTVHGFFRDQWSGVPNHPRIGGGIGQISLWGNRIGTGVDVFSYSAGTSQMVDAKLYYAQKITLAKDHRLSVGLTAGFVQYANKYNADRDAELVGDPNFNQPSFSLFDMNIGLAYQWKKLTVGFAIPNVLDANTRVYNTYSKLNDFKRNYIIHGSYEIGIANGKFNLEPQVVFKVDQNKTFNMRAHLMANYKQIVFLGAGYNLYSGIPVTAGVKISKVFTVAYSYQIPLMRNVPVAGIYSTHEVVLGVCFDKWMKKGEKVNNPGMAKNNQTDYDSLLSRKAWADSLTATQKTVDSLAQKLNALQLALENAQKEPAPTAEQVNQDQLAAQEKELTAKLDALNKEIEERTKKQQQEEAPVKTVEQKGQEQATANEAAKQTGKPAAQQQTTAPVKTQTLAPRAQNFNEGTETTTAPKAGDRFNLDMVSFARNGSELDAASYAQLDKLVAYLQSHKNIRVRITGHTDSRASEEYNGWLSRLRARAVSDYLKSKGIAANRIEAIGMGPVMPVADNETEEGRAKNRRVEVEILK